MVGLRFFALFLFIFVLYQVDAGRIPRDATETIAGSKSAAEDIMNKLQEIMKKVDTTQIQKLLEEGTKMVKDNLSKAGDEMSKLTTKIAS